MNAHAVIGAAFGDEGKGLMTDYLASQHDGRALVVRFNGGAQAGHTVVAPNGVRHVFHHIGAGTLAGADTFLSRHFIVNPLLWSKEIYSDGIYELKPRVMIDPAAPLTTPFDMLINQAVEESRGSGRHGSCGVGINETITRNTSREFATYAGDLFNLDSLLAKLQHIHDRWVPERAGALGFVRSQTFKDRAASLDLRDAFLGAAMGMQRMAHLRTWENAYGDYDRLIFEGAQGLLLDEVHGSFPHVTRSRTGLTNVIPMCEKAGVAALDVVYVVRAYMTRHGPGPFPSEHMDWRAKDTTNIFNQWQGVLRFGDLDPQLIGAAIDRDQNEIRDDQPWVTVAHLAVTHADQVNAREKIEELEHEAHVPVRWMSVGPTRDHVVDMDMDPARSHRYTGSLAAPRRLPDARDEDQPGAVRLGSGESGGSVLPVRGLVRDGAGGRDEGGGHHAGPGSGDPAGGDGAGEGAAGVA